MPLPSIYLKSESKYLQAVKAGDEIFVRQYLNTANYASNYTENGRALVIAFENGHAKIAEMLLNQKPSLFQLCAADLDKLLYPALRLGNLKLLELLNNIPEFKNLLQSPNAHTISLMQDMAIFNERAKLLEIMQTLWPDAAAMRKKFPKEVLSNSILKSIVGLGMAEKLMQKITKQRMPTEVSNLIFSYIYHMKPIKILPPVAAKPEENMPESILKTDARVNSSKQRVKFKF